jgi:signal transduction histidine kinase
MYAVLAELTGLANLRESEARFHRLAEQFTEADRRKDAFLATLAHELRNPLAPILNAVQVLRLREAEDESLRWACDVIDRQSRQLTRLVEDLLDIARIAQGKVQLRRERVDLAAIVARAVETSKPLIDAVGHGLAVTLPAEPIFLDADPARLEQVLANLLNNASKYMEPGGNIWLAAERAGQEVVVRVRDAGIGISSEMLPRLFTLFTQVDRSLCRSQGGLGIGLSLVKSLVEMHGGTVAAFSDGPDRGSTFVVRLPAPAG